MNRRDPGKQKVFGSRTAKDSNKNVCYIFLGSGLSFEVISAATVFGMSTLDYTKKGVKMSTSERMTLVLYWF